MTRACDTGNAPRTTPPGPSPLPECDYCGDDFLDPKRGYKRGCPKHDPYLRSRQRLQALNTHYAIARAVIRRSSGSDVETALLGLDDLYAAAKEAIRG